MIQANSMTQIERLQAMEELWDSLCHDEPLPEPPSWHEQILSRRRKQIESGEAEFITLEELKSANH